MNNKSLARSAFRHIHIRILGIALCTMAGLSPLPAQAAPVDVVVVTDLGDADPLVAYIQANFGNVGTITTGTFTSAHSNTTQNQQVNDAELVIVARGTSTSYDDSAAEVDFWNGLSQPMVLLTGYIARSHRWVWVGTKSTATATDDSETGVLDSGDPLFSATTFNLGKADLFNDGLAVGWPQADNTAVGGGQVLGTAKNSSGRNVIGVVRFPAGSALATGSRGTRTTHGGDRILFAGAAPGSLTVEGEEVLANALIQSGLEFSGTINAQDDAYSLYENAPWSEDAVNGLLANDFEVSGNAVALVDGGPASGTVQLNTDGSFTYTPDTDFAGTDTFTYHFQSGAQVSNTATVTLDVQPAPADLLVLVQEVTTGRPFDVADLVVGAQVYYDDGLTVEALSPGLATGAKLVRVSDRDLNYHGPSLGDGSGATDPSKLVRLFVSQPVTVYIDLQGVFDYLPDWLGPHHDWALSAESFSTGVVFEKHYPAGSFWLGANDRMPGSWITRNYTVAIAPEAGSGNNPPYAWRDFYDLGGAPSLQVNATNGVTANDTDSNGDTLGATLVKDAAFGTLNLYADGSFNYEPGPDFTRWDSFQYMVNDGVLDGNATTVTILNGQPANHGGHTGPHDPTDISAGEHAAVFELAPHHAATHIAAASGDWSAPSTWVNGIVPIDNANVLIPEGLTVTVDGVIPQILNTVRSDGLLRFATGTNTELVVDTVMVDSTGGFEMGTVADPVAAGVTARLVIADNGPVDTVRDPRQLGRGLIAHGPVRMHGQDVTDFEALAAIPAAGATQLVLKTTPVNWNVGDTIVIPHTTRAWNLYEERTILAIAGDTVTINSPLVNVRNVPAPDLELHVAHLDRNVQIMSESTTLMHRGHVMFMHSNDVQVHNVAFNDLGRTDKGVHNDDAVVMGDGTLMPLSGTNVRARYSLHFHRAGGALTDTHAVVTGSVVNGNPGWGFVNHGSIVDFSDNVAYEVNGAGFSAEAGDEAGSFHHNMAVGISGVGGSPKEFRRFDNWGTNGDGFWLQAGNVLVTDNIAANCRGAGFSWWLEGLQQLGFEGDTHIPRERMLDPSHVPEGADTYRSTRYPVQGFSGNITYGSQRGIYAWNISGHDQPYRSPLNNHTAWRVRFGVQVDYAKDYELNNLRLLNDLDNFYGWGIWQLGATTNLTINNADVRGFKQGLRAALSGTNITTGGVFQNNANVMVDYAGVRNVEFIGTQMLPLPGANPLHVWGTLKGSQPAIATKPLLPTYDVETISFCASPGNCTQFWYTEQAHDYVPYPEAKTGVPAEYIGLTNQELWDGYGLAVAGEVAPLDSFTIPEIGGLITEIPYFMAGDPNILPAAGFSHSCTDLDCSFTDNSSDSDGTIVSRSWDFGDGGTSTLLDPDHSFAATGTYTVELTVTDNDGASSTASQQVAVSLPFVGPTAGFTYVCTELECSFTDSSSAGDGSINAWSWSFGDGNVSTMQSPVHSYAIDGVYIVALTVTDSNGLSNDTSSSITLLASDTVAPTITAPADISVEATGEFTAVDLGTPTVSDDKDPSPVVTNNAPALFPVGTTTVTWTATDASGNSASDTQTVTVTEPSVAQPPAAPTNLVATVTRTNKGKNAIKSVVLTWDDNSANEDYFVIERCQETGKGKSKTCDFQPLTTTTTDPTYGESGLSGTFMYRVRAENAAGSSDPSNTVKI